MKEIVRYFIQRPVVANALMFGLILAAILFWEKVGKEEMPEFSMNWVRVTLNYPGASSEDVELFVTKPIEEKLKGVSALEEVSSTSSYSTSSFRISFEPNLSNLQEKVQEVKDAIDSVDLPSEVDEPVYRQFRSAEKAIIDIGLFLKGQRELDVDSRIELQKYALAFKNRVLSLPEISGIEESGYLRPELQIKIDPKKLEKYELSLNQVRDQIVQQNLRRPLGSMKDQGESEVTLASELETPDELKKVIVSSGFQGQSVQLGEIAEIENGFEVANTIIKVQGREGIIFNIQKSSRIDILSAQKAIVRFIDDTKKKNPQSPVDYVLIDDESYDVRNRLDIIGANGLIGFLLIVLVLFLFLDFKTGVWVALGIPFSLAFTLIAAMLVGYTINNMTLAAIIIVLGIVVDDAIIVAENIIRHKNTGETESAVRSTLDVASPVIASVLTTCAAFLPLYFFSGRFGLFVKYIPTIVFFMLFASLIESFFILPSHMAREPKLFRWFGRGKNADDKPSSWGARRQHFTQSLERHYARFLDGVLQKRIWVLFAFLGLFLFSGYIFQSQLRYVMFPREESRDFRLKVVANENITRYQMSRLVSQVEDVFLNDKQGVVTSVRTSIGQNRRGGEVRENEASVRVEITPPSERKQSLNQLIKEWQKQTGALEGFAQIRFQKSRFGSDSGSPIAIEVQENNDQVRKSIVESLKKSLEETPVLTNVELEKPVTKNEFRLKVNKEEVSRRGVNYAQLASTLRAYVEGEILYVLNSGEEEIDVRFTSQDKGKSNIESLLDLTVANQSGYLVPLKQLLKYEYIQKPTSVQRVNYKRVTSIYADIREGAKRTPLEIAEKLEQEVFPKILAGYPTANIQFRGEVEDSRESQSDFSLSIIMVLAIIYILLIFLFDSLWTPLLIGSIIPFGIIGSSLAFWAHGMSQYGFFAVVGTLGMIGVVINDSIVLIDRLKTIAWDKGFSKEEIFKKISEISSTRLRAVVVTTITTVAGLFPTAYGIGGYDAMLAEMMLAMGWGLLFGMFITLLLAPILYSFYWQVNLFFARKGFVE